MSKKVLTPAVLSEADAKVSAALSLREMYEIDGPYARKLHEAAMKAVDCLLYIIENGEREPSRIAAARTILTAAENCAKIQISNRLPTMADAEQATQLTDHQRTALNESLTEHPYRVQAILAESRTPDGSDGVGEVH